MGPLEADEFSGKIAWVTGAASGIGRRHAERLAKAGSAVGCIDRDSARLRHVVDGIRAESGVACAAEADVSDWAAMVDAARLIEAELGPAELVVANAALPGPFCSVRDVDPAAWQRVLAVNLTGAFHTVKAALSQMRADASIVFISSAAGIRGYANTAPYGASKHGVMGLMRTVANEVADERIRVNAVCPGLVDTPMIGEELDLLGLTREEARKGGVTEHLIDRLVTPDEVCDASLWLLSSKAAMVTGVALPVDGGGLSKTFPRYEALPADPEHVPAEGGGVG